MAMDRIRYWITRQAMAHGPSHPATRFAMSLYCRRFGSRFRVCNDGVEIVRDGRVIRLANGHFAYARDIARHFDAYFSQVEPEPYAGGLVVDYSRPRLHKYRGSGVEFEIASLAEEETAIESYFRWYVPKPGDLVFDIGAYCGVSTYHLAKLIGPAGLVHAFEPDPNSYELLLRNVKRHSLSNVVAHNVAIAGRDGTAEFNSEGGLGSGLTRNATRVSAGRVTKVETMSFENACRRFGFPTFVKMDVEGAELEIISAAGDFLRSSAIDFTLDTNHRAGGELTFRRIERLFSDCGYETLSCDDSGFMTTWARKRRGEPQRSEA